MSFPPSFALNLTVFLMFPLKFDLISKRLSYLFKALHEALKCQIKKKGKGDTSGSGKSFR
jgi:hypothetical protein